MRSRLLWPVLAVTCLACEPDSSGGGPTPGPSNPSPSNPSNPGRTEIAPAAGTEWFRKAVFYEALVRAFDGPDAELHAVTASTLRPGARLR